VATPTIETQITANEAQFLEALARAANATKPFKREVEKTTNTLDETGKNLGRFQNEVRTAFSVVGVAAVGAFTKSLFDAQVQMERTQALFTAGFAVQEQAAQFEFVTRLAREFGLNIVDLSQSYGRFAAAAKTSGLELDQLQDIFRGVTTAVKAMSLSAADADGVYRALFQMLSKGKVQAEELVGQLGERLPGALDIFARSMGVSTGELLKMVKNGEVMAKDTLPAFAEALRIHFQEAAEQASQNAQSSLARFSNSWTELKRLIAQGLPFKQALGGLSDFTEGLNDFLRANGTPGTREQIEAELRSRRRGLAFNGGDSPNQEREIARLENALNFLNRDRDIKRFNEEEAAKLRDKRILRGEEPLPVGDFGEVVVSSNSESTKKAEAEAKAAAERYARTYERVLENSSAFSYKASNIDFTKAFEESRAPSTAIPKEALAEIDKMADSYFVMAEAAQNSKDSAVQAASAVGDAWFLAAQQMNDAFVDRLLELRGNFRDLMKDLVRIILQSQIRDALLSIFGSGGTFGASGLLGGITKLFGGGKAAGGSVSSSRFYVVGEQGPEVFVPRTSGTIIPNGAFGGGGMTYSPIIQIDASGADADRVLAVVPPMIQQAVADSQAELLMAMRRNNLPVPR
jgi:tape measure domain-containing protein